MTEALRRINLMVACGTRDPWVTDLAAWLKSLPIDLHWSKTDTEAVGMAASGRIHAGVVDSGLPLAGGLDATRRIRRLGIDLPLVLVCDDADERVLQDALALNVFSVVQTVSNGALLTSVLCKAIRQLHGVNWPDRAAFN